MINNKENTYYHIVDALKENKESSTQGNGQTQQEQQSSAKKARFKGRHSALLYLLQKGLSL